MAHHAFVGPVHRGKSSAPVKPDLPEIDDSALLSVRHCECGDTRGQRIGRPTEGLPAPNSPADAVRKPAQVSFWLLEPVTDAAMTYFYAQLFAMDTEIRAMFPAAMDLQRRRFFEALGPIADAQQSQADRDRLVP
jgi:hypothetical protein